MVRSSWVGPTPPVVSTKSKVSLIARTSLAITSTSSGITSTRSTSAPTARSSRQRNGEFESTTFPERISFPMITIPAVGIQRG
jgi:hypothetical protein